MASNSILLLAIFLMVSTEVYSYDEDLKIVASPQVPAPVPPVKTPTTVPPPPPTPPMKSPSYPPPNTIPTPTPPVTTPPTVKVPPPQPPIVKLPTPPVAKPPTSPVVNPPVAPAPAPAPVVKSKKDCIPLCAYRCQLHSRKNICQRACLTCCDRCKCVPPGTYGNREKCGKCYTDMLTHGNRYKCP